MNSLRQNIVITFTLGIIFFVRILISANVHAANFDELIQQESNEVLSNVSSDPDFLPFRNLPKPLLHFLILEKKHLYLASNGHMLVDEHGQIRSGFSQQYIVKDDSYHSQYFRPFVVKGYWIPENNGDLISIVPDSQIEPWVRTTATGQKEILFLVHPKSESLFAPLMTEFSATQVDIPALSLSSFRTLLVALPATEEKSHTEWTHWMVKVSLDETINRTHRTLSAKECGAGLAASYIIKQKMGEMSIMEEVLSFVPGPEFIAQREGLAQGFRAGMIVRPIHPLLLNSHWRVIPFFALLGRNNRGLLGNMIVNSGLTPTEFVAEKILRPYARFLIDLVINKKISIEAHAQNLMLVVNEATLQPREDFEFLYRDMGGVTLLLTPGELACMPAPLSDEGYYYFQNFIKDAALTLEDHFVSRVLFPLTKEFVQDPFYEPHDGLFHDWKMKNTPFLRNWINPQADDDSHLDRLIEGEFCQYGYFEKFFGSLLIEELEKSGILQTLFSSDTGAQMLNEFQTGLENLLPTHSFEVLLRSILELRPILVSNDSKI